MLGPVLRTNKKYYSEAFLEECKFEIKKSKMENLIHDDLDPDSPDESDCESDNEYDSGSDNETW